MVSTQAYAATHTIVIEANVSHAQRVHEHVHAATDNEGEPRPTTQGDRTETRNQATDTRDLTTNRSNDDVRELRPNTFSVVIDHVYLSGAECRPTVQVSSDARRQARSPACPAIMWRRALRCP